MAATLRVATYLNDLFVPQCDTEFLENKMSALRAKEQAWLARQGRRGRGRSRSRREGNSSQVHNWQKAAICRSITAGSGHRWHSKRHPSSNTTEESEWERERKMEMERGEPSLQNYTQRARDVTNVQRRWQHCKRKELREDKKSRFNYNIISSILIQYIKEQLIIIVIVKFIIKIIIIIVIIIRIQIK